jgi:hypothetical protein
MSRRLKILITAVIVIGVAVLVPVIRHYQLRAVTEAYIAQLKAQGEPMELAQVIPPPVPPEKNGVPFITNALANLKYESIAGSNAPQAMRGISAGRAMIGWQQSRIIGFGATNTWEDLGRELAAAKNDIDSFQNLTNHPVLDFSLDYEKGFDLLLPYLASLKRSAQWLSTSALYNLHEGDPKSACADVHIMLAIAKGDSDECVLISQLVRIAITAIGANATWEILQNPNVSDDDLAQLQQDWQSLDFTKSLERAFMFGRVEDLQECSQTRESSEKFNELWRYAYAPDAPVRLDLDQIGPIRRSLFLRKYDELRWRWFWSYQDELYGLQSLQVAVDATRMAQTNKSLQAVQSFASTNLIRLHEEHSVNLMNGLRDAFGGGAYAAALRKAATAKTAQNVVITAIALRRYELRHHQWPDTLDELVPEFLKSVPTDSMDGQPLRYRRNGDGTFLLYSVGENGKDDGGNPGLEQGVESSSYYWQNFVALDWVWPQPATPEEVQNYYAHPPN